MFFGIIYWRKLVSRERRERQERHRENTDPPYLLSLVRAFFAPAFVIGGWQLMATSSFWGLTVVYLGFAFCLAECIWEPALIRKAYQLQICLIGIVIFLTTAFTIGVALVFAPLNLQALAWKSDFAGSAPGGIAWRPVFVGLDLIVSNPTDGNYDNIDLWVRPDYPVAQIAQLSNLSEVSFEDKLGFTSRVTIEDVSAKVGAPMVFLATDAGYKVHCARIPPNSSLRIVMAVVDIKKTQPSDPKKPISIPSNVSIDDFFLEYTLDTKGDKSTYWFGSPKNLSAYAPGAKPKQLVVSGAYTASSRRRTTKQNLAVNVELVNK